MCFQAWRVQVCQGNTFISYYLIWIFSARWSLMSSLKRPINCLARGRTDLNNALGIIRLYASFSEWMYNRCSNCWWAAVAEIWCKKLKFCWQQEKLKWIWQLWVEKAGVQWTLLSMSMPKCSFMLSWEERKGECGVHKLESRTTKWWQKFHSLNNCFRHLWRQPVVIHVVNMKYWSGVYKGYHLN